MGDDYFTGNHSETDVHATTIQPGLNYNVTENITFFGNYSTSFAPQTTLDPAGNPFPNQKGKGFDTGLKFDLFARQLFATVNYFDITCDNIVQQVFDPVSNSTIVTLNGSTRSNGMEVSLGEGPSGFSVSCSFLRWAPASMQQIGAFTITGMAAKASLDGPIVTVVFSPTPWPVWSVTGGRPGASGSCG